MGQRVTLECAIPPQPEPDQVRWYRNEVFLELSPDYQQTYRDGICSLTMPRVGPEHSGKYSCVVVIRGVPNSSAMELEVYAPAPPPPPARPVCHLHRILVIVTFMVVVVVVSIIIIIIINEFHRDASLTKTSGPLTRFHQ